jgi:hypothetical protein
MLHLTFVWAEAHHPKLETWSHSVGPVSLRVTEVLPAAAWQALMKSVDYWPMAITIHKILGGKPKPVAACGVTGGRYPPPERRMPYSANARCAAAAVLRTVFWGTQWGQLDGLWEPVVATAPGTQGLRHAPASSCLVNYSALIKLGVSLGELNGQPTSR